LSINKIPYGLQSVTQADIDSVVSVLQSDFLTQGPMVPEFESKVAKHVDAKYAVAVNSATSALHIACLALDLGEDDWLWTSPNTFVASANCALHCGAKVDFVDIDLKTYNICPVALENKLEEAEKFGQLPKVVVPVHYAGQSCDMQAIYELSRRYGFKIIEDASHAIGGNYKGNYIGNGRYSNITIFSFHPVKIITSGEGGMAITNDVNLFNRMQKYRSHGITSDLTEMERRPESEIWNYQQIKLGLNYRMTDIHAALGISQMMNLDGFVAKRNKLAKKYDKELKGLPIVIPLIQSDVYSTYHLYVIRLKLHQIQKTQKQIYSDLREAGILVNIHYIPVYLHPYYMKMGFVSGYCSSAEQYFHETLSIPIYPKMRDEQQDRVIDTLHKVIN